MTLVAQALDLTANSCKRKYVGAQTEKKAKYTDYSMQELFADRLQQKIDKRGKVKQPFEYTEGFSAEIQTFVKTNYDLTEYDIDFK